MIISAERSVSDEGLQLRCVRAMAGLKGLGLPAGTPVATMLHDGSVLFEVSAAAGAIGSPVVPIDWHLKAEDIGYILASSGARALVCHADLLCQVAGAIPDDLGLFVVETPPEIAAAYDVAAANCAVPSFLVNWDTWCEWQTPVNLPTAPGRCSIRSAPRACRSACAGTRYGRSRWRPRSGRRHRLRLVAAPNCRGMLAHAHNKINDPE